MWGEKRKIREEVKNQDQYPQLRDLEELMDEREFGIVEWCVRRGFLFGDEYYREDLKNLKNYLEDEEKPPWWRIYQKISYHSLYLTLGARSKDKKP